MISNDNLHDFIIDQGAAFVGYSYLSEKLPQYLNKFPYAITFGIRLSDAIIDEIEDKPTFNYFNHYRSVNFLIDQIALRTLLLIQNNGHAAYTIGASQSVPTMPEPHSGIFPHKTGAVASGMGWIGKNGLFIHKEYGPRVRLGTILTDMELSCNNEILSSNCTSCLLCVKSCPAHALTGNDWVLGDSREMIVDAHACSVYMNKNYKHIGRGSVCGICIKVCPNRKTRGL